MCKLCIKIIGLVCFMVFNTTFNNISVILWRSVLLVEETGVLGENHRPVVSHWQTLSHNIVSSTPCYEQDSDSLTKVQYTFILSTDQMESTSMPSYNWNLHSKIISSTYSYTGYSNAYIDLTYYNVYQITQIPGRYK